MVYDKEAAIQKAWVKRMKAAKAMLKKYKKEHAKERAEKHAEICRLIQRKITRIVQRVSDILENSDHFMDGDLAFGFDFCVNKGGFEILFRINKRANDATFDVIARGPAVDLFKAMGDSFGSQLASNLGSATETACKMVFGGSHCRSVGRHGWADVLTELLQDGRTPTFGPKAQQLFSGEEDEQAPENAWDHEDVDA